MKHQPFIVRSDRVVSDDGIIKGWLYIENGKIESINTGHAPDVPILDAGSKVVMPGIIDPHVHINEPGRTHWEGFVTATQAAAAGGTTTLVDMPLNATPVTVSQSAFKEKLKAAAPKLYVNVGFWGGLVPSSATHLEKLITSGVLGIKVFLCPSGIEDFPQVTPGELKAAMPILKEKDLPLLVHAELISPLNAKGPAENYATYLASRPPQWELDAIKQMIGLCDEFKTKVHIVHLSSALALPMLQAARNNLPLTVETCPHYLFFSSEDIPQGGTEYKCAPPIRTRANNESLWKGVEEGIIDFIATDHSPAPPEMKLPDSGDFLKSWGGISSVQFLLPLVWTLGRSRNLTLDQLVSLVSSKAAKFIGLHKSKGKIARGYDADLVIWDPDEEFMVTPDIIKFRHKITPYLNCKLYGKVKQTIVGGHIVYDQGKINNTPRGNLIIR